MPRAIRQYAAIAMLAALATLANGNLVVGLILELIHPDQVPAAPFSLVPVSRTIATGAFAGDQILAIDGKAFNAARQLTDAVLASRPGDILRFTLSEPAGEAIEREVTVASQKASLSRLSQIAIAVALRLLVPVVDLTLGFAVVLIRPTDRNAWLVLCLMLGFVANVHQPTWEGMFPDLTLVWYSFWNTVFPIALVLFGIWFPTRSASDQRWPWIKYGVLVLFATVDLAYWGTVIIWQHDIAASPVSSGAATRLHGLQIAAWMTAAIWFLANFRWKIAAESSGDGRRRLKILRAGSLLGLGPLVALRIFAVIVQRDLFQGLPPALTVTALLPLPLFPLTLGYVIVVERAMDLRFVIRTGMKYGFARSALWLVRAAVIGVVIYVFAARSREGLTSYDFWELAGAVGMLLLVRRQAMERSSLWIDRKFFREAYNAERVLAGLASEAGKYFEVKPLLERVAVRIGETLHVAEIVILLRAKNGEFQTAYSTREGEPMDIPADGRLVANLGKRGEPLEIYFDKPPEWLRTLSAQELQALDFMRTQLLLPVMGREGLSGIVSLGPKLSEAPYSETDIRLLQAIAWQTGLAIDNSQLVASLAEEAANRERLNYELEIAREVQERLFPQSYPVIAGLEYSGYCRPARGVGGDYYDFLQLPEGKLGVAIGDVSGKGIAAALLMASLLASLRAQVISGSGDLARLMTNVNRLVLETSTPSRYATCFYAEYNPVTRELGFVNAGHNAPFILRGEQLIRLETGGPVVGLLPKVRYEQAVCPMLPGDILILFTDGINEAMTASEEEWGEERLIDAAREYSALDSARMIQAIFRAVDAFTGAVNQYDDMTLLVIKLTTPAGTR